MKKNFLLFVSVFCLATVSFATVHTVSVADFSFTPSSVTSVHIGDTILWTWSNGTHTTTSETIPVGAATWNSSISSTVTSFMYVPTVVGTYNYECTIHASMGMTGTFTVVSSTGINDVNKGPMVTVYPNPASGTLHIQFNTQGTPVTITLTDMNGKQVVKRKYKVFKDADIDVQDVPNGTYVLYAKQGNDAYNQQVVIVH